MAPSQKAKTVQESNTRDTDTTASPDDFQQDVTDVLDEILGMLLRKNAAYGNSALDPVRVFSKASTVEQLLVRIDDKLSRLKRGAPDSEDVERDLLGYLVLLRVARKRACPYCSDLRARGVAVCQCGAALQSVPS